MPDPADLETDPRFPSGKWVGFFLDRRLPGRHQMELTLTFTAGRLQGDGRDWVGRFTCDGAYDVQDGKCTWVKCYVGRHTVGYSGFNEGKGIWGMWELRDSGFVFTGGFHIWPEGMADPTRPRLAEEADLPVEARAPEPEPALVPG
jgi:hypothetical protein